MPITEQLHEMDKIKEMWDSRYSAEAYAYGTAPNAFFKDAIKKYKLRGKILLPAEGEGRNAVYAAKKGLDVTAFDISKEGKNKALKLAARENVTITYKVGDFLNSDLVDEYFDSAALIFAHFPPPLLSKYHKKISELISPNGMIILEGFSKNHLQFQKENPQVGGPKNIDFLFTTASIQKDFPDFDVMLLEEVEVTLNEGAFHKGIGSVVRFVGRKRG